MLALNIIVTMEQSSAASLVCFLCIT